VTGGAGAQGAGGSQPRVVIQAPDGEELTSSAIVVSTPVPLLHPPQLVYVLEIFPEPHRWLPRTVTKKRYCGTISPISCNLVYLSSRFIARVSYLLEILKELQPPAL